MEAAFWGLPTGISVFCASSERSAFFCSCFRFTIFSAAALPGRLLLGGGYRRFYCGRHRCLLHPSSEWGEGLVPLCFEAPMMLWRFALDLASPVRSLRNLLTNRRIPGIFRRSGASRRRFSIWCAVSAFGCITSLPNCPHAFPSKCPNIPDSILCRLGDFFLRIAVRGL